MTGPIGATLALSVAVTSRLVTVVVDLIGRDRRGDAQPRHPIVGRIGTITVRCRDR